MFCQNCGNEIKNGTDFCESCGKPFEQATIVAPIKKKKANSSKLFNIILGIIYLIVTFIVFIAFILSFVNNIQAIVHNYSKINYVMNLISNILFYSFPLFYLFEKGLKKLFLNNLLAKKEKFAKTYNVICFIIYLAIALSQLLGMLLYTISLFTNDYYPDDIMFLIRQIFTGNTTKWVFFCISLGESVNYLIRKNK